MTDVFDGSTRAMDSTWVGWATLDAAHRQPVGAAPFGHSDEYLLWFADGGLLLFSESGSPMRGLFYPHAAVGADMTEITAVATSANRNVLATANGRFISVFRIERQE